VAQAVVSTDGLIVAVNDEMCALFGQQRQDLLGAPILCPEQHLVEDEVRLQKVLSGDVPLARFERRAPHPWAGPSDLLVTLSGVVRDGAVEAAAVCVQDITEQKSAQRRAEREEGRWRSLSQNASDVALVTDADLRISYASPALTALLGFGTGDTVGTSLELLVHPDDAARVTAALRALVEEQGREEILEFRVRNSAGEWRYVEQHVLNLLEDPHVRGLVVNLRDRTELHELRLARRRAVLEDRLTGLPNRALVMDRVQQAIERRHGGGGPYALLFVDLDRLRAINDTYGQAAGDEVLRRVSDTLCALVGPADTVGRYAGDEFVVLLDEAQDLRIVERIAARICAGLSMDIGVDADTTVRVSACVGVALGPATSAEALISAAEAATYRAKGLGRGRVHVLEDGLRDEVAERRRLGIELAAAVAE
jgi:diguanylate cyclase (GGDEF)-like protein/PAS domain S-box-containing protein